MFLLFQHAPANSKTRGESRPRAPPPTADMPWSEAHRTLGHLAQDAHVRAPTNASFDTVVINLPSVALGSAEEDAV